MASLYVDASALVCLIELEPSWRGMAEKLQTPGPHYTSPVSIWEATNALMRLRNSGIDTVRQALGDLLTAAKIEIVPITAEIGDEAIDASMRFGKGRHPAKLNMGDCFSYGCAKVLGAPLLYLGDDFARTDIRSA